LHRAIDFQLPFGTAILAPEDSILVGSTHDNVRGNNLGDMTLIGEDSSIIYGLAHIIIEDKFKDIFFDNPVKVKQGDRLGEIGLFPYAIEHDSIPKDVKAIYGKSFNHLHFDTAFFGSNKEEVMSVINLNDLTLEYPSIKELKDMNINIQRSTLILGKEVRINPLLMLEVPAIFNKTF